MEDRGESREQPLVEPTRCSLVLDQIRHSLARALVPNQSRRMQIVGWSPWGEVEDAEPKASGAPLGLLRPCSQPSAWSVTQCASMFMAWHAVTW